MQDPLEELKNRLKKASLVELEKKCGVSRQYLHRLATGRDDNPTIKTIKKIESALNEL